MTTNIEWNEIVGFLKNTGIVFSVFASGYSLVSIFKNKPKIDVDILDVKKEEEYLVLKLSFQNSGKQMSSATSYLLELNEKPFIGFQKLEQKIYPTGNHSISRPRPKYVEAYPLELPQGKACHFSVYFNVDSFENSHAVLRINLINHRAKKIAFEIPEAEAANKRFNEDA